jgi:hypothetical protein
MNKRRRGVIMVAVQALDRSSRPLLRKAHQLAKARGCDVELVHVIALPYAPAVSGRANSRQAAQDDAAGNLTISRSYRDTCTGRRFPGNSHLRS